MVADAHPSDNPGYFGGYLQTIIIYAANAPHGIYPKLPVWRENTGRTFINLKYLFHYGKR